MSDVDPSTLHPEHGGRVLLELATKDAEGARYRVTLFTPEARFEGEARVEAASGAAEVPPLEGAPSWLVGYVQPLLRQLWVGQKKAPGRWPRRVMRWRAPK
ncbi:MAG TPA: hypothetical protein RMH85_35950 [Polyangiaceae bacterium LLY-WYZ-15_(1-7)]|nr:hypothetical protein [Polyangiaceae bacterium LLY-WYZ-15_(1-7)]HJL02035.1 hypothetical protein [Polyangiaceae bacterium LLY-WYZ-15_(1-7)]HJL13935.1 hypothetical protein [Polyangiaceae bacterium LLY-WYZ-15_(1-7)]HJL34706.1 hypothetical protein [Polyangiaceae bacterium LLY-WYZ-15_(1-7)]HJL44242.1 hypothetical protein [Polyangiaceae bacterium LLY-WYZ-15_(1-7)]